MTTSVLSLVQSFCRKRGLPAPNSLLGSRDSQVIQITELLRYVVEELVRDYRWEAAVYEATFTTVNGSSQGNIETLAPNGFISVVNQTIYNRTRRLPLYGPMTEQQWQRLLALPNPGPYYKYRIQGNLLKFLPNATAGETCAFEYTSSFVYVDVDGLNPHGDITADGDQLLLDPHVLKLGLEARWLEAVGMDWITKYQEFRTAASTAKSKDASKPVVNLNGETKNLQPGVFVPTGSWF